MGKTFDIHSKHKQIISSMFGLFPKKLVSPQNMVQRYSNKNASDIFE